MLSIEEIKLLIEKLEKAKATDFKWHYDLWELLVIFILRPL